ncbi:MAG: sulfurtransferase [Pirellulaceae bacterium]|nr:MAG: sulfurtransferase [Pirellulaceae bacterium]
MNTDESRSEELPWEIEAPEVARLMQQRQVVLVDCREPEEYELAHIAGAVLIPMSQWEQQAGRLDAMRGQHVVVHCHHGVRSRRVVHWLRSAGFAMAQSMAGGIEAWSQLVDPTVPTY